MAIPEGGHISTVDDEGKRKWIYAWQPSGDWYDKRTALSILYLMIFFGLPFIKVHGKPFFMLNFPNSVFVLFGKVFLPQDFVVFSLAMLIFLVFIVLFTVVYGRVFCGWMCPQTIFMEMVFRKVEYWIEGSASQQRKLNNGPRDNNYYTKKIIKHSLFLLISFLIANTAVSYIYSLDTLREFYAQGFAGHLGVLSVLLVFMLLFYGVFAFVREIVCTVVCPYGRLQEVLLDKDSIVVAYDYVRGEPRKKGKLAEGFGDCVDCDMCVRVCPTGIDIRDGKQLECVNCTACIDACNSVMEKVHKPKGLIRYASEENITKGTPFHWTSKIKFYTAVLVLLIGLFSYALKTQKDIDFTIIKVPGQVLQEYPDGSISNLFRIIVDNKSFDPRTYDLKVSDPAASIEWVGQKVDTLKPLSQNQNTFFLKMPGDKINKRKTEMQLSLISDGQLISKRDFTFIGEY